LSNRCSSSASGGGGKRIWSSSEKRKHAYEVIVWKWKVCGLVSKICTKYIYGHGPGPPAVAASGVTGGAPGVAGGVGRTVPPVGVSFNLCGRPKKFAKIGVQMVVHL
jgi:hypothetical protein